MRKLLRAGLTAATICLGVSSAHALPACAPVDFNADCKSDILWRNAATGENYIFFLNGLTIASEGSLRTVADPNWTVAGTGDFNGDGKADILWRNAATGENYVFFLNGLTIASEGFLRTVTAGTWQVKGIGDFNGDGKADILKSPIPFTCQVPAVT